MAQVTIGRDPHTGKLKCATFYAKTRQATAALLAKALRSLDAVSVALELRRAFGLEGGDSFAVILGTRRHAHGASDRL